MAPSVGGRRDIRGSSLAVAVVAIVASMTAVAADTWPPLRQGMWEIARTMQSPGGGPPTTMPLKRCMNPSDEWQRQQDNLTKAGCTMTPVKKSGNTYTFSASCNMMGVASKTTTTIVAEGDSAYTMTVEGETDGKPTKEKATGKRLGDCTK
jgi:hypothetical protein